MEAAVEAFHHIRNNFIKPDRESNNECVSEFSEDYNSVDSHDSKRGILKRTRSLPQDEFILPQKLVDQLRKNESLFSNNSSRTHESGFNSGTAESGFNSEQNSSYIVSENPSGTGSDIPSAVFNSELGSNYLENYGLNGPIPEYHSLPQISDDKQSEEVPLPSVTSIGTRKKKQDKEVKNATIRQHYYPEGGWGYIVLTCALAANILAHGLQLSFGVTLLAIQRRWGSHKLIASSWLGGISICVSLLMSPLTIAICKRKSTRITAVVGGLILSLGCLFTSFASQFHQIFFSYGIIIGIGVSFVRDTSTLMVAQYFKRKRESVEIVLVSASGLGISIMSTFLKVAMRDVGWRLGLQSVTGVLFSTFILGTFYRSATLYHPQRRAILHLKSQKRKIKDKNKSNEEKLPFYDFSSLKSRTFQIILLSSFITSLGMFTPFIFLLYQSEQEKIVITEGNQIQTYLGLAWICGVLMFGLLTVKNSVDCHIGRQYLCQAAGLTCGISVLAFTSVQGTNGYLIFVWIFGIFAGGYQYSLKMFVFEKVRARNFARAWGILQMSQSIPVFLGVPIAGYINSGCGNKTGYYFSGGAIIIGSFIMFLVNVHKSQLRKRKLSKHRKKHASFKSTTTRASDDSYASPVHKSQRRNSFPDEEDEEELIPAIALINSQQALIDLIERRSENGMVGIEELEIPDHLLFEDYEMLDNITSCNAVDNYLMLDEYEQNLIKEHEEPVGPHKRFRKWSLVRQPSSRANEVPYEMTPRDRKRSVNNNVTSTPSQSVSQNTKRTITTIDENSV